MRAMISLVASRLAVLRSVPARDDVARPGTARRRSIADPATRPRERRRVARTGPCRTRPRAGSARRTGARAGPGRPCLLEAAGRAPRALGEHHQHVALVEDPLGEPERLHVRGTAVDRVDRTGAGEPAEDRPLHHLALAEPVDAPAEPGREPAAHDDAVRVREVVRGDDQRPVARDPVDRALDRDPGQAAHDRAGDERPEPDERGDVVRERARRAAGRSGTRRSRVTARVGARVAPSRARPRGWSRRPRRRSARTCCRRCGCGARRRPGRSGATARLRSISSRRRSWARIQRPSGPSGSVPRSSARRRARSSTEASRKILRSACGQHDRPDVAPGDDDPAVRGERALDRQEGRPHVRGPGHVRDVLVHELAVDVLGDVAAVDDHPVEPALRVRGEPDLRDERDEAGRRRPRVTSSGEGQPGQGAVQEARVARTGSRAPARLPRRRCSCPTTRARRGRR